MGKRLRQMEKTQVVVGENTFYISRFPAFKAANITGELASVLVPLFSAFLPLLGDVMEEERKGGKTEERESDKGLMDIDAGVAVSAMQNLSISGDKIELLMNKLLMGGHIVVEIEDEETGEMESLKLDHDTANEIFCGEVQEMFILCFHVIRLNFNGFFKKVAAQSGKAKVVVAKARQIL